MASAAGFELDEFDEMAFGLGPSAAAEDPMQFLNSKEPPPLRIASKAPSGPALAATKLPLDGLSVFSDEDDDLFPSFNPNTVRPKTAAPKVSPSGMSQGGEVTAPKFLSSSDRKLDRQDSGETATTTIPVTRPATASIFDRLTTTKNDGKLSSGLSDGGASDSGLRTSIFDKPTSASTPETPGFGAKPAPIVKSSLFKNLVAPPWEQKKIPQEAAATVPQSTPVLPTPSPLTDKAEAERQRRAMIFGGSSTTPSASVNPVSASPLSPSTANIQTSSQIAVDSNELISKVLQETKQAEEDDHRRVSSHHDFIRQQTQQAVQLQQSQANEFLKEYLAENKKQLNSHLSRLRSGFPLMRTGDGELPDGENRNTVFGLEKKVEILERKLEDKDSQLAQYSALMMALEDQHREELRDQRLRHDEAQQRAAQTHHEYVVSLLANHESVRKQYEEALENLRDAVSAKSSLEVVRGTVEQSAREFAIWRTELEQRHDSAIKEKDGQLQMKENQVKELTAMLERQSEKARAERELLQQRIQDDTSRLLRRQNEVEEQAYTLQRERLELESERKNFHSLQIKEMARLEKRMEETLRERQETTQTVAEEKHIVEEEKRKLADTIRAAEDKYAVEYKKRQLILDSAMEAVAAEKRLLEEKHRNLDREVNLAKDDRERLDRDRRDVQERKTLLEKYNEDVHRRDLELEQTALRVAKMKRDSDLALHEAKFMDEEHKTRVAKFNIFLEQLRDKELSLMRQAVTDGSSEQRTAIQLPNGSLTVIPRRLSAAATPGEGIGSNGARVQLLPNPARDVGRYWQGEREYLQVLKNTPWSMKKPM
ncbi:hypothetical protein BV898_10193 [Hypsibius exemplaris]|uniref:Fas-binding factor 1 n=1 Tax=Hypsibius exemplaris TaxID=2072580 RepID=A0A1W0WK82_HYPEX|nr:hypothetical protein BV898_10193 [Hypsibius exemplaris]